MNVYVGDTKAENRHDHQGSNLEGSNQSHTLNEAWKDVKDSGAMQRHYTNSMEAAHTV